MNAARAMRRLCAAALFGVMIMHVNAIGDAEKKHVTTKDIPVADDAYLHGYTHNCVTDTVAGKQYPTITIQCVNGGKHVTDFDDTVYSDL